MPATLRELREEIGWYCAAIPAATWVTAFQSVAYYCQLYHKAEGHFEHLD
jgi:hypothetical protein